MPGGGETSEPSYLAASPSLICWESEHMGLVIIAIPALLITLIGVPALYYHILCVRLPREGRASPRLLHNFGFLYSRFEDAWTAWEVPIRMHMPLPPLI